MDKPWFFSDKPEINLFDKISSYQDLTSKQTLILVSLLSFKNSNPESKKKCWVDYVPNQM